MFRNATYEELWQPAAGPHAPWTGNNLVPGQRNNLAGFVEDAGPVFPREFCSLVVPLLFV